MQRHIHFGIGAFSLGFSIWFAKNYHREVVVVSKSDENRSESLRKHEVLDAQKSYYLISAGVETRVEFDRFVDLSKFNNEQALRLMIEDRNTTVLSFSLKDKNFYSPYLKVLRLALISRFGSSSTYPGDNLTIFLLENDITPEQFSDLIFENVHMQTVDHINRSLRIAPSVIDRICSQPYFRGDSVCVQTESYGRLTIELQDNFLFNRPKDPSDKIYLHADKSINISKKKKLWILNGSHLLISINAHFHGYRYVSDFAQDHAQYCESIIADLLQGTVHYFSDAKNSLGLTDDDIKK